MIRLTVRLRASLLSGLFLLGALGVPLADGAMFHVAGQDPCAGVTHVEAHGGQHHADRCTLAQPVVAQREALGSIEIVRTAPPESLRALIAAPMAPADATPRSHQHSRAPPA